MAAPHIPDTSRLIPTMPDVAHILNAKLQYESAQKTPEKTAWNKANFSKTPWGIAWLCSKASHSKALSSASAKGWDRHASYTPPAPKNDVALKTFIIAVLLDWQDLIVQIKRTLKNWGYSKADIQQIADEVWLIPENAKTIADAVASAIAATKEPVAEELLQDTAKALTEAVEKHDSLNPKLFNKEELLKDRVRDKLLDVVDEFLNDLKEQDIEIKVDDILLIGSNASYNYTKDSDIDLHILTNTTATKYSTEVAEALYSAYRSLFNKQLKISIYGIPLEIFVETENSSRVSNGTYSVKKNKWIRKPIHEEIPDYDAAALEKLVNKWEMKCKALIADIKADRLDDEKRVVKLIEDIYDKLRKKGVAKSEYSLENLAFKELRNKGYLDKLKDYRNELISKRLSLEERLDRHTHIDIYRQITRAVGSQPIIQDNGMFFIYDLKASEIRSKVQALRALPFVIEVQANESSKYDFSNPLELAINRMPNKYYNIRGKINVD